MPTVEHKAKVYDVDEDGFLSGGIDVWDENWVDYVKEVEAISDVVDDHWACIKYLQDYYRTNGLAPPIRHFTKTMKMPLKRIYELFPSGPAKGACKMAGLPKPTGCV